MSYYQAKQCFDDNVRNHVGPHTDPVMYNLNVGLAHLAQQFLLDQQELEQHLRNIENQLRQIQGAMRR